MQRLDEFVTKRQAIARHYDEQLASLPVMTPYQHPEQQSAYHLYPIQVRDTLTRQLVFQYLRNAGIGVNVHYIPVYTQPDFQVFGFKLGHCPAAEAFYKHAISLPVYPCITEVQLDLVLRMIKKKLM